jgi:hypothetical protein
MRSHSESSNLLCNSTEIAKSLEKTKESEKVEDFQIVIMPSFVDARVPILQQDQRLLAGYEIEGC